MGGGNAKRVKSLKNNKKGISPNHRSHRAKKWNDFTRGQVFVSNKFKRKRQDILLEELDRDAERLRRAEGFT